MTRGKRALTPRQARAMFYDLAHGMSKKDAAAKYNIGYRTIYYYLNDHEYRPKGKTGPKPKPKPKKPLQPCGTNAAYARHKAKGEIPCPECYAAHSENQKKYRPPPKLKGHGTDARYARHRRDGEDPCKACKEAHNRRNRMRDRKRKRESRTSDLAR